MDALRTSRLIASILFLLLGLPVASQAADGPIGIDHRLPYDNTGIWQRRNQQLLQDGAVLFVLSGALWEGDDTRLGHTFWQAVDSIAMGAVTAEGMKYVFSRSRPAQIDDPNKWSQGSGHRAFRAARS